MNSGREWIGDSDMNTEAVDVCGEIHPLLCEDEAGEVPLVCGLQRGHAGEHQDRRECAAPELRAKEQGKRDG